jgi:hypothetical protein
VRGSEARFCRAAGESLSSSSLVQLSRELCFKVSKVFYHVLNCLNQQGRFTFHWPANPVTSTHVSATAKVRGEILSHSPSPIEFPAPTAPLLLRLDLLFPSICYGSALVPPSPLVDLLSLSTTTTWKNTTHSLLFTFSCKRSSSSTKLDKQAPSFQHSTAQHDTWNENDNVRSQTRKELYSHDVNPRLQHNHPFPSLPSFSRHHPRRRFLLRRQAERVPPTPRRAIQEEAGEYVLVPFPLFSYFLHP